MNSTTSIIAAMLLALVAGTGYTRAQGTAFTYQGRLNEGANPANGTYNLRFGLHDAIINGAAAGAPVTNAAVAVSNGLFSVTLDFGAGVFTGAERWLEIGVGTNFTFTTLTPRQKLTSAPYAVQAANAGSVPDLSITGAKLSSGPGSHGQVLKNNLGQLVWGADVDTTYSAGTGLTLSGTMFSVNFSGSGTAGTAARSDHNHDSTYAAAAHVHSAADLVSGTLPSGRLSGLYSAALTFNNAANSFTGNGAGLRSLNASSLSSGTVPDARLSGNVALLDAANVFQPAANVSGVTVRQTTAGSPTADIFGVQNSAGAATFLRVDSAGALSWSGTASGSINGNAGTASSAPWSGLTGVPAGFADNVDNDTTYSAGTGLLLSGTVFSIADGGVGAAQLADGAVTTAKLADMGVTASKIFDGAVTEPKIDNLSVNTFKLAMDAVTTPKLANAAVTLVKLANGAVDTNKLSPSGASAGNIFKFDGVNWGLATDDNTTYTAGTGLQLSGTLFSIGDGGVGSLQLTDVAVTTAKIADGSVTEPKIDNLAVNTFKLASGAVITSKLGDGAVTELKVANGAITSAKLRDGAVLAEILDDDGFGSGLDSDLLDGLNSTDFAPTTHNHDSTYWKLSGNSGTTPGTHFLGTTDNQPLEFKVNGLRALRLEDNGDGNDSGTTPDGAPNVIGGSPRNFVGAGVVGVTIAGGGATNYAGFAHTNSVLADFGFLGGGIHNRIAPGSLAAAIAGGYNNDIGTNSFYSAIGGGQNNNIAANSPAATIAGGQSNDIGTNSDYSAIGGGNDNDIAVDSPYGTIAGGQNNDIGTNSDYSAIGGGFDNNVAADSPYTTVAGGQFNDIGTNSDYSAIGGGSNNNIAANSPFATIAGGGINDIGTNSFYSAIGGGYNNNIAADSPGATIAGGSLNGIAANSQVATIAGALPTISRPIHGVPPSREARTTTSSPTPLPA